MRRDLRLLCGPLGAVVFCVGVAVLALMLPGYSHVHQTISEIGAMDSSLRVPFAVMIGVTAVCMWVFAWGVHRFSATSGRNPVTAILIACMGISAMGVGIFATPHPLHNVFGLSEIVGYQAPLAFALTWRKDPKTKALVAISWVFFVLLWIAMGLNMSTLSPDSWLAMVVMPVYGLVQRSLFLVWFSWCTLIGWLLWRDGG